MKWIFFDGPLVNTNWGSIIQTIPTNAFGFPTDSARVVVPNRNGQCIRIHIANLFLLDDELAISVGGATDRKPVKRMATFRRKP